MKLRSFATILALAVLPAYRCVDILPEGHELLGDWVTDQEPVVLIFPDGQRTVQGQVSVSFLEDRHFVMQMLDDDGGRLVVEYITRGTYTARGGRAELTVTEQYQRSGGAPVANPVVAPTTPYTPKYHYTVSGTTLTLVPICPPGALCVEPHFTQFHKILAGLPAR